ncbi:MAG: hypothetical protein L0Y44_15430 [Phycisphaerales bacterium]|nr:hypothetical protein [Phycisphaerales bacterium]MCI0632036.1 hypothetical protein [Phycisphaerales bacterium]MCI0676077.1 hypothetical protein [Phycisphaerales bacterium]
MQRQSKLAELNLNSRALIAHEFQAAAASSSFNQFVGCCGGMKWSPRRPDKGNVVYVKCPQRPERPIAAHILQLLMILRTAPAGSNKIPNRSIKFPFAKGSHMRRALPTISSRAASQGIFA